MHCGNLHWSTGNDKFAGTHDYCKEIYFGFFFPSSLRNAPGLNQVSVLGSALHTGSSDSIFSSLIWNLPAANFIRENQILILDKDMKMWF